MTPREAFEQLEILDRELVLLEHINAVLGWDQQTVISEKGNDERAVQMALIEGRMHELATSDVMGEILGSLGASDAHPEGTLVAEAMGPENVLRNGALVRIRYEAWSKGCKIPSELVQRLATATGKAHGAWVKARSANDWQMFLPYLEEIVTLTREKAVCLGGGTNGMSLYDALLDLYEPGMKTATVAALFSTMKKDLVALLSRIKNSAQPDDSFLYRSYPIQDQDQFGREVLKDMGFDFSRGALGLAAHPFTTTVGEDDIRITTRYTEPSVASPLFSTIHEGGHAIYEQGASNVVTKGSTLANGASCAFHESQSRLWENIIGHSASFWKNYYPRFKELFPTQTEGISLEAFIKGINKVEPSMIRVNADEVTYGLHIILRFELEQDIIEGKLSIVDLPQAWNKKMEELLGIVPDSFADGVLQDIHWAGGDFGYFPTYALGNLYGAQIWETLCNDLGGVDLVEDMISKGNLKTIKTWLDKHVYQYGMIYRPADLLEKVTGRPLDAGCFTGYLEHKYSQIYGF